MKELKVGERIRIFAGYLTYDGVVKEASRDFITCQTDINAVIVAHRKQCRRLKKKEKKAPRKWYITIRPDMLGSAVGLVFHSEAAANLNSIDCKAAETLLVREVLPVEKKQN